MARSKKQEQAKLRQLKKKLAEKIPKEMAAADRRRLLNRALRKS